MRRRTNGSAAGRVLAALFAACCTVLPAPGARVAANVQPPHGGPHDFDFEFGRWSAHLERLVHPLSGSHTWVAYDGTSVVHELLGGRGNIGEFDVRGPAGHIQGVSLRLYDPQARRWNVTWASADDGALTKPMLGGFSNGRGAFYNEDTLGSRPIEVRFRFTPVSATSFRLEQAFSADGGATWEANWKVTFRRA